MVSYMAKAKFYCAIWSQTGPKLVAEPWNLAYLASRSAISLGPVCFLRPDNGIWLRTGQTGPMLVADLLARASSLLHDRPNTSSLQVYDQLRTCLRPDKVKKVKASHTRYQAWGSELIPVYRQSACR